MRKRDSSVGMLQQAQKDLYASTEHPVIVVAGIRAPTEARADILSIKQKLSEYHKFKAEQAFLSRREKMFKGGWRHGITGVEDPSANPSVFYRDALLAQSRHQAAKDFINTRRRHCKYSVD